MTRHFCLILILLTVSVAHTQEVRHAPIDKKTQCRADHKLWLSVLDKNPSTPTSRELQGWHHAMTVCALRDDPQLKEEYLVVAALVDGEQASRMEAFLVRHHWLDLFVAEDEQGKRTSSD